MLLLENRDTFPQYPKEGNKIEISDHYKHYLQWRKDVQTVYSHGPIISTLSEVIKEIKITTLLEVSVS